MVVLGGPRGADDVGAAGLGDLHGEVADSPGGCVDQDPVVLPHVRHVDERLPSGEPGERKAAGLLIEDTPAEDDIVVRQDGFQVFVDPFSAQYINGVTIDYVSSMQGSGFTFKNPNATGGCGCGSSFTA